MSVLIPHLSAVLLCHIGNNHKGKWYLCSVNDSAHLLLVKKLRPPSRSACFVVSVCFFFLYAIHVLLLLRAAADDGGTIWF